MKKLYIKPSMKDHRLVTASVMAGSGGAKIYNGTTEVDELKFKTMTEGEGDSKATSFSLWEDESDY